ncbi:hypothetical protein V6N13_053246 [Hibiscus sabdariffa]|uniref:Uncharacterized protein n=2 Tax=Hibiscus sabdariffa TaxID=183260 RepID=A0ABR2Q749_9ROSI
MHCILHLVPASAIQEGQLQCWCLNFRGHVTMASIKNFQLSATVDPPHNVSLEEQEKVIIRFGKIGKGIFTMDYQFPLSAFQAFAICLVDLTPNQVVNE